MFILSSLAAACLLVDMLVFRDSGAFIMRMLSSKSPYVIVGMLGAGILVLRTVVFIYEGIRGAKEESRHRAGHLLGPWPGL